MTTMASKITTLSIVYSFVYSDADQRKHQSSASLAFVRGIHRWPWTTKTANLITDPLWKDSPNKGPVTSKWGERYWVRPFISLRSIHSIYHGIVLWENNITYNQVASVSWVKCQQIFHRYLVVLKCVCVCFILIFYDRSLPKHCHSIAWKIRIVKFVKMFHNHLYNIHWYDHQYTKI